MKNCVTILGIALTLTLPHAAHAQGVTPPPVPDKIEVLAPDVAFLLGRGFGTQNYECQPVRSLGRVDWVLFTPQATLFGDRDEQLTTHFLSPNPEENGIVVRVAWQDSRGHEHRVGPRDRILCRSKLRQGRRDSLAQDRKDWSPGRANGGRQAIANDVHPTVEYRWGRGALHGL